MILAVLSAVPVIPARAVAAVDAAAIDAVVRDYRQATRIPGVAVAVTRGRDVVRTAGFGRTADGMALTDRTVTPIASLSKSITALAVMQLVEAGQVRLDAPVRDHLPEFTLADERASAITVRQLLEQTSGLSDTTNRARSRPVPGTLRETVAAMRSARLAADPGTRYEYHNPNYQVAARLVEVVDGRSFDDYLRHHVFGPLGMTDSRTIGTPAEAPAAVRGHRMIAGMPVAVPEPPDFGNGSGGVLSTARDMAAWLIAQTTGDTPILSPAGIAATHRPGAHGTYGLGWDIGETPAGAPLVEHTGGLITATAYQAVLPAQGYGIAVMANAGSQYGDASALGARLIDLIEGRPGPAPEGTAALIGIDVVLLLLTVGVAGVVVRGIRRARCWASYHRLGRPATVARLLPYLLPLTLLVTLDRVVSFLYRGQDIAWRQTLYLFPAFTLLLAIATVGCIAVLAARLYGTCTPRRGQPAEPPAEQAAAAKQRRPTGVGEPPVGQAAAAAKRRRPTGGG
ncbi:beta-lactamase family protein [Actinoplanes sp. NEAU-A11]|uniref:Beta-lactamase family protein n=1 Tax=Actinoplanes aureus TaxID=2792083 RepID=A0A931C9R8_9ACTN|nr:beta-lactamase family protein [Actinoplanes aureus]